MVGIVMVAASFDFGTRKDVTGIVGMQAQNYRSRRAEEGITGKQAKEAQTD